ncbi:hypothetical protein [Mucilaginibacter dorajii]|uniref:Lipocalin-like domain-containing protein n=1 Tax=Mucilaginibacter dorajii TaxID=692994 RepID=A0ABP7PPF8_9SPHI|nr:hypothetical protein [Mucilaginibacter dorajii]MCS3736382.1 hypothetical protein [Mucilaginibacter dorajii]
MKRIILLAGAALCGSLLCFATLPDLSGRWTGSLKKADSTLYPLSYQLTLIGDSVAGTANCPLGNFPIDSGKLDTSGLHFIVTVNGLNVYHQGTVYADSIGMDINLNGSKVHTTLGRATN